MGYDDKVIERNFIECELIGFYELIKLYNKYGVTFEQDGIKLYVDIVTNTKPKGFDGSYAKLLKNSLYDRKAKTESDKIKAYMKSLLHVVIDNLYDEDDSFMVIKHIPTGRFMRLNGHYSSYNGLSFFGELWYEVTPKEIITVEYT